MFVSRPEDPLVQRDGEAAADQVVGTLLEGDSEQGLCWGSVVSPKFDGPGLISVVSSSRVFKWHSQVGSRGESHNGAEQMFVRVPVGEVFGRPGTAVDVLPHR